MDLALKQKFDSYPHSVRVKLWRVRQIIVEVCEVEQIGELTETLKWGEPSYLVKGGSTVRMDWKAKSPEQIYLYFHCQTTLVETFKEIYGNIFEFQGKRAIILPISKALPIAELKYCFSMSLRYHKIKHLPLLGN